jgi:hypothetical protein
LAGKPQLDAEGRQRIDPETGKRLYTPVVEIADKARRDRFQAEALAAVDKLRNVEVPARQGPVGSGAP